MKIDAFKPVVLTLFALSLVAAATSANAHDLRKEDSSSGCEPDGSTCYVYCHTTQQLAGTMNWNGTVWTDGVKSDPDQDGMARKIVAANGSSCD